MQRVFPVIAGIGASLLLMTSISVFGQATWVHFDTNGYMVYKTDNQGNRIPDFSYAGYEGGGVALPSNVTVQQTVSPRVATTPLTSRTPLIPLRH